MDQPLDVLRVPRERNRGGWFEEGYDLELRHAHAAWRCGYGEVRVECEQRHVVVDVHAGRRRPSIAVLFEVAMHLQVPLAVVVGFVRVLWGRERHEHQQRGKAERGRLKGSHGSIVCHHGGIAN